MACITSCEVELTVLQRCMKVRWSAQTDRSGVVYRASYIVHRTSHFTLLSYSTDFACYR